MGFGANSRSIQTFKIERLSEDLPIVVEVVDTREKREAFCALVEPTIGAGLVILKQVAVRFYGAALSRPSRALGSP